MVLYPFAGAMPFKIFATEMTCFFVCYTSEYMLNKNGVSNFVEF